MDGPEVAVDRIPERLGEIEQAAGNPVGAAFLWNNPSVKW